MCLVFGSLRDRLGHGAVLTKQSGEKSLGSDC